MKRWLPGKRSGVVVVALAVTLAGVVVVGLHAINPQANAVYYPGGLSAYRPAARHQVTALQDHTREVTENTAQESAGSVTEPELSSTTAPSPAFSETNVSSTEPIPTPVSDVQPVDANPVKVPGGCTPCGVPHQTYGQNIMCPQAAGGTQAPGAMVCML